MNLFRRLANKCESIVKTAQTARDEKAALRKFEAAYNDTAKQIEDAMTKIYEMINDTNKILGVDINDLNKELSKINKLIEARENIRFYTGKLFNKELDKEYIDEYTLS
jgi:sugar-specific transcriptional regulator TrmB